MIGILFDIRGFKRSHKIIGLVKCCHSGAKYLSFYNPDKYYPIVSTSDADDDFWNYGLLDESMDMYSPFDGTNIDLKTLERYVEAYEKECKFEFVYDIEAIGQHVKIKENYSVELL